MTPGRRAATDSARTIIDIGAPAAGGRGRGGPGRRPLKLPAPALSLPVAGHAGGPAGWDPTMIPGITMIPPGPGPRRPRVGGRVTVTSMIVRV